MKGLCTAVRGEVRTFSLSNGTCTRGRQSLGLFNRSWMTPLRPNLTLRSRLGALGSPVFACRCIRLLSVTSASLMQAMMRTDSPKVG